MEPLLVPAGHRGRPRWALPAAVLGLAALLRGGLAVAFPTIHGGDAAARLANAGTLVLGYQLPLPQSFVTLGRFLSDDPLLARLFFCVFGGVLAAGVAALLEDTDGAPAGLFAGLLLAFAPLLIHYSVVPYQEPLAYGLVAWSLVALRRDHPWAAAALMAFATLCRYEAWLFLPVVLLSVRRRLQGLLAAAPVLVWIAFWRGLAPRGQYVLDIDLAASRVPRISFLLGKLIEYETVLPALLGLTGLGFLIRSGNRVALAFVSWMAVVIAVVVGLGHEFPPGSGLMSERLIHLPVILMAGLAALALARISRVSRSAAGACLALTLVLGARNARFEVNLLRAAAREPDLALARDTARAIERVRRPGECVTVTAPRVDPALLRSYVAKVGASWGDVPTATARAAALEDASPDRDRIAAHLRAPSGTVIAHAGCALGVSVDGALAMPPPGRLVREISAGPRRAVLYRSRD